ncbi:MAG: ester cyclase [Acidobacteriota bacterium]|nr:ester cyclase [Acidobacteriota bacterium]
MWLRRAISRPDRADAPPVSFLLATVCARRLSSEIDFVVEDAFQDGNKIAKRWVFRGTHTRELNGIPATGKRITLVGATLARMVDRKIVEERDFADDLGLLQQLGVIPTPE